MDLSLYLRVLWRFRVLAGIGLVLASVLAVLSLVNVSVRDGFDVSYRDSEQWSSTASIFITQQGFPLGRSIYDEVVPVGPSGDDDSGYVPKFADPSRFASYAQLYARLAASDMLERRMRRTGPLQGTVTATPGVDPRNPGIVLPLVEVQGLAATAADARATADRATKALVAYVEEEQVANDIAENRRIILRVLDEPSTPALLVGRTKTRPLFIFVAVLMAFAGLIFLLQNLRPEERVVGVNEPDLTVTKSRRSA